MPYGMGLAELRLKMYNVEECLSLVLAAKFSALSKPSNFLRLALLASTEQHHIIQVRPLSNIPIHWG